MMPSRVGAASVSLFEQLYGCKIDFKRNLRAAFGDYAHTSSNVVDSSITSKSEAGIALYDTGNAEDTLEVYSIETK